MARITVMAATGVGLAREEDEKQAQDVAGQKSEQRVGRHLESAEEVIGVGRDLVNELAKVTDDELVDPAKKADNPWGRSERIREIGEVERRLRQVAQAGGEQGKRRIHCSMRSTACWTCERGRPNYRIH